MRRVRTGPRRGVTLIEVLVALAVLSIVFLLTSSGIVTALQTYRVQESTTSAQSKMRRVVEVVTQELRGAVLGGISNFPVATGETSVSFLLLAGSGGLTVLQDAGWGTSSSTQVFEPNLGVIEDQFRGFPALVVNANDQAVAIPNVTGVDPSTGTIAHAGCVYAIDYTPSTQLFSVRAMGFRYADDEDILYLREVQEGDASEDAEVPFAFGITGFEIEYQYEDPDGTLATLTAPPVSSDGTPLASYDSGGTTFDLARFKLTISTDTPDGRGTREYASFIEMTGVGGGTAYASIELCDATGGGEPDPPPPDPDPIPDPDPEPDPDPDPPGGGGWPFK
jgi:prepilin-type N-terminal cleavage/methylation domain-containing protein